MKKKPMGIVLIITGAVLIICGVLMLSSGKKSSTVETVASTSSVTEAANSMTLPASASDETVATVATEEETSYGQQSIEHQPREVSTTANASEPSSKEKGDAFEDFVVNLLADWRFKLLDRTQDAVSSAGVVAESCKNPDLHVQQKRGKTEIDYYLECKYRSKWSDGVVTFKDWQFDRYRKFQKDSHRKVLIALGVGGTPSSPSTFMVVPLDSIKNNTIRKIDTQFVVSPSATGLADYMQSYFTTVFKKAKK